MRIDYSTMSDLQCSTRAWLSYCAPHRLIGVDAPGNGLQMKGHINEPMRAGSLVHEVMEEFWRGEKSSSALWLFEEKYHSYFPEGSKQERYSYGNMHAILSAYTEHYAREGYPWKFYEVEHRFELPWGNGIEFFGRIDGVVKNPDGSLWIVETKSTGYIDDLWSAQWSTSAQLMGYVWAARQLYPGQVIRGAYVNALEIKALPPSDGNIQKKCRIHGVAYLECQPAHVRHALLGPFVFSEYQLEQWRETILFQATALDILSSYHWLDNLPMEGMFVYAHKGNLCSSCQFKPFCHVTKRSEEAVRQLMESRPAY